MPPQKRAAAAPAAAPPAKKPAAAPLPVKPDDSPVPKTEPPTEKPAVESSDEEENNEPCEACGEVDCDQKDDICECSFCSTVIHCDDMIYSDDPMRSEEFCDNCDLVESMPCTWWGCRRGNCGYQRSTRMFECQAM